RCGARRFRAWPCIEKGADAARPDLAANRRCRRRRHSPASRYWQNARGSSQSPARSAPRRSFRGAARMFRAAAGRRTSAMSHRPEWAHRATPAHSESKPRCRNSYRSACRRDRIAARDSLSPRASPNIRAVADQCARWARFPQQAVARRDARRKHAGILDDAFARDRLDDHVAVAVIDVELDRRVALEAIVEAVALDQIDAVFSRRIRCEIEIRRLRLARNDRLLRTASER